MTQVWSATQINAHLTGGGTTSVANTSGGNAILCPVYGSQGVTTGKLYWETATTTQSTWDTARAASGHLAFSNSNKTVTYTGTAGTDSAAFSLQLQFASLGRFVCRFNVIQVVATHTSLGFGDASASTTGGQYLGIDTHSFSLSTTGAWRLNNASTNSGAPSSFTTGDAVDIAIDLIGKLAWWRRNLGTWYGNNGVGDPVAGTNGFDISGLANFSLSPACSLFGGAPNDSIDIGTQTTTITNYKPWSSIERINQGIGNTSSSITDNQWIGISTDTLGVGTYTDGLAPDAIIVNSVYMRIGFTVDPNDRIGHALDLVNNLYWANNITKNTAWYGAATTGDPASASNGFSLTQSGFTITAHPVVPALQLYYMTDTATGYFDPTTWLGTRPSGFLSFNEFAVFSDARGAFDASLAARSGNERRRTIWI